MIKNSIINKIYKQYDLNTAMCELLDLIKYKNKKCLEALYDEPIDPKDLTEEEYQFVTIMVATIEYQCCKSNLKIPDWISLEKFRLKKPYFFDKGMDDFTRLKMMILDTPTAFKNRDIFVSKTGLERI